MTDNIPDRARVVVIGGGIVGCSVAYHLTKLGWKDVIVLERKTVAAARLGTQRVWSRSSVPRGR